MWWKTTILICGAAMLIGSNAALADILYVDADATGANDGSSWENAFIDLQDALTAAEDGDEIRVAQGTYKPDQGAGVTPGDREATFQLINGVALKGGYAGFGEPDPDGRDIQAYETILSGDLAGNDVIAGSIQNMVNEPTRAENSLHVVTGSGTDETSSLEGFVITGGNAHGPYAADDPRLDGGGMYTSQGSPTATDCLFRHNSAGHFGGGMYNEKSSHPHVVRCRFVENATGPVWLGVGTAGGGIGNAEGSNPIVTQCVFDGNWGLNAGGTGNYEGCSAQFRDCEFVDNVAGEWGAGLFDYSNCASTVIGCRFIGNHARKGGGGVMVGPTSHAKVMGCLFRENTTDDRGGGMLNYSYSNSTVTDCVFANNAAANGGGMCNRDNAHAEVKGCIFAGNTAIKGAAMLNGDNCNPIVTNCTIANNVASSRGGGIWNGMLETSQGGSPTLVNCILWSNSPQQIDDSSGVTTATYSDVQGGWPGVGNIDADPNFVDPDNGDYHLMSPAGHWDPNTTTWVTDEKTSPCIDTGDPMSPIGLEPFPNGGRVNMGAYGGMAEASKSYFGAEPCDAIVAGDINGDCRVDVLDLAIMALHWLEDNG